jgi:hypothetical protein
MLSTKHGSSLSTTSRRNRITNEIIRKPNVVTNYNKYMGGVDRSDQMISYTNNVVKSFKWWKKASLHTLHSLAMFVFLPVPLNLDIKCFAVNLSNC